MICDPKKDVDLGELERMTRRYTSDLIEFPRTRKRRARAPDVNTNEQVMAWIMDTYSMHMRQTVTSVVTGTTAEHRRDRVDAARSDGTRHRRRLRDEALKYLNMQREGCRVIIQGFSATWVRTPRN